MNVFTYGSLMFSPVWDAVVLGNYRATSAVLEGHARRRIVNDSYPVAFPSDANETIIGMLYHDVSNEDIKRLDFFEGEYYQRSKVSVRLNNANLVKAEVYLINPRYRHLVSEMPWDPDNFQERCLSEFMSAYEGFMDG